MRPSSIFINRRDFLRSACRLAPTALLPGTITLVQASEALPSLGPWTPLTEGVRFQEVLLGHRRRLWIYLPADKDGDGLPCVVIAAAGSRMFHGLNLVEGDKPEHLPYADSGFAVVAYSIDGWLDGDLASLTWDQTFAATGQFLNANGGIDNARIAMDFAIERLRVDSSRLFAVGHSSAATLALQFAIAESRVRASVAYAPVTYLKERLGDEFLDALDSGVHGFKNWVEEHDPIANASSLKCPTLIFHARDDSVIEFGNTEHFVDNVRKTNPDIEFVIAESGDHYDSMINEGIPAGMRFLQGRFTP